MVGNDLDPVAYLHGIVGRDRYDAMLFTQTYDIPIRMSDDITVSVNRRKDPRAITRERFIAGIEDDAFGNGTGSHRRQYTTGAAIGRHHLMQHFAAIIKCIDAGPCLGNTINPSP